MAVKRNLFNSKIYIIDMSSLKELHDRYPKKELHDRYPKTVFPSI